MVPSAKSRDGDDAWWASGIFSALLAYFNYFPAPWSVDECRHSPLCMLERRGDLDVNGQSWSQGRLLLLLQNPK